MMPYVASQSSAHATSDAVNTRALHDLSLDWPVLLTKAFRCLGEWKRGALLRACESHGSRWAQEDHCDILCSIPARHRGVRASLSHRMRGAKLGRMAPEDNSRFEQRRLTRGIGIREQRATGSMLRIPTRMKIKRSLNGYMRLLRRRRTSLLSLSSKQRA